MLRFRFVLGLASAWIALVPALSMARADADAEFFEKQVRPLLVEHCAKCHGDEKPKGKLKLTSKANLLTGGESGPAAVAGKPEESLLVHAIRYRDEPKMPPKGKLSENQIAILTKWVEIGMPWPETTVAEAPGSASTPYVITDQQRQFWSFQPVKVVPPPAVKDHAWPKGEIDRFILSALESKGLRPAAQADKRTLIRRASFDLTGLPPTPEEIDAFLKDENPDAFGRVVDRLLASPAYGERWARHWLDVVRYADSLDSRGSGQPGDILDAWRYRDWVVQALNADLPYDRFVKNQIAGDLLPPADVSEGSDGFNRAGTIATTMLAIGNWGNGDADKEKILTDIADDQVDVVSKAFLGLTVSCARCHDHKFDPIPTKDYYGLAGIFFSTHILPKLTPKGAGETIIRVPLDSPGDTARRKAHQERLATLDAELKALTAKEYAEFASTLKPQSHRDLIALWEYQNRPADQASVNLAEFATSRGLAPFALRQWSEALGVGNATLLSQKVPEIQGNPGLKAWNGPAEFGSATANLTNQAQQVSTFRLPPRSLAVHPGPSSGVAVTWTSPMSGLVRISGRVADADPSGGDGILWYVDHRSPAGGRELASGEVANGGATSLAQGAGGDALASVAVRPGDCIRLTIMPKGNYTCDTTTVDVTISSWSDASTWDVTRDILDDFHAGNPHADRLGHPGVWRFEDLGTKERPAALSDDKNSPAASWQRSVLSGDRGQVEAAATKLADSIAADDKRSPLMIRNPADESALPEDRRERLSTARSRLDDHRRKAPAPVEFANAAQDGGVPESSQAGSHDVRVHIRGRYDRLGEPVPRHFPIILGGSPEKPIQQGSGRRDLAEWIVKPGHPLTARVLVNRLWLHHFGEGIVRTPSNFGKLGDRPSHPELLDFLADRLVSNGWSLKAMHRLIMLSATYQQSSTGTPEAVAQDAENRLFGRMNRRRLEAEVIRDNLLSVSGRLDRRLAGPPEREFNSPRRGLYVTTIRSDRSTFGALFDQADSTAPVDRRIVTTVAPQSLFMLNNPFVLERSHEFADRLRRDSPADDPARIQRAYLLLFGRDPTDPERAIAQGFLAKAKSRGDSETAAWDSYAHILICANEFLTID
ncbi:MAG: Planctomycete cytochrome [Planctomycetota bacterium]|nr:Planctomycete cytochrome [Planctomycetota bacterium]